MNIKILALVRFPAVIQHKIHSAGEDKEPFKFGIFKFLKH